MPNDRRENDVLNSVRASGPDVGKLGKFPHDVDNARVGDLNVQMEKPMQIAEPQVQQEEDQVLFFVLVCYWLSMHLSDAAGGILCFYVVHQSCMCLCVHVFLKVII